MAKDTTAPDGRPTLDAPPPMPPGAMRRTMDTAAMAPAMGMGANPLSSATLPQALIERAMLAEQALTELAQIAPSLVPTVAQMIDTLRTSVASQVQGPQQPAAAPMGMMGPMMGAAQPAGPGPVAPAMM